MNKFLLPMLFSLCALLPKPCAAAEDMRFVDAVGDSGYYVDVNSVSYESNALVNSRIAVKKAGLNRMYVYAVQFDRVKRTYQIYASQVIKYDNHEILENKNTGEPPKFYSAHSPMNTIVDYLFAIGGAKVPPPAAE